MRVLLSVIGALFLSAALSAQTVVSTPTGATQFPVVMVIPGSASQVVAVNGSTAFPSITFASNPTTGFIWEGSATVDYVGNGNRQLQFGSGIHIAADGNLSFPSTAGNATAAADTSITRVAAGEFGYTAVLFASLGTPANGTFAYCSDCTIANPCAGAGTGAWAKRLNGVWVCN